MKKTITVALVLMILCGIAFAEGGITVPELIQSFYPDDELICYRDKSLIETISGTRAPKNSILASPFSDGNLFIEYQNGSGICYVINTTTRTGDFTDAVTDILATQKTLYDSEMVESCWLLWGSDTLAVYEFADNKDGAYNNWEDYCSMALIYSILLDEATGQ